LANEKERYIGRNGKDSEESVSKSINKSQRGNKVIGKISSGSWCTPRVSVITIVVCNCGGYGYRECKKMLDK